MLEIVVHAQDDQMPTAYANYLGDWTKFYPFLQLPSHVLKHFSCRNTLVTSGQSMRLSSQIILVSDWLSKLIVCICAQILNADQSTNADSQNSTVSIYIRDIECKLYRI